MQTSRLSDECVNTNEHPWHLNKVQLRYKRIFFHKVGRPYFFRKVLVSLFLPNSKICVDIFSQIENRQSQMEEQHRRQLVHNRTIGNQDKTEEMEMGNVANVQVQDLNSNIYSTQNNRNKKQILRFSIQIFSERK